jgi:hypothetical protein
MYCKSFIRPAGVETLLVLLQITSGNSFYIEVLSFE